MKAVEVGRGEFPARRRIAALHVFQDGGRGETQVQGLGINIRRIFTITFLVASGLAGFGGVLNAPLVGVAPYMGFEMLLYAFTTVILGGLGSIKGTLVSALILGQVISVGAAFYSPLSSLGPFIVMFVVILIKPTGLYGIAGKAFGFEE